MQKDTNLACLLHIGLTDNVQREVIGIGFQPVSSCLECRSACFVFLYRFLMDSSCFHVDMGFLCVLPFFSSSVFTQKCSKSHLSCKQFQVRREIAMEQ